MNDGPVSFIFGVLIVSALFFAIWNIKECSEYSNLCNNVCKSAYGKKYISAEKDRNENCICKILIKNSEFGPYLPKTEKE